MLLNLSGTWIGGGTSLKRYKSLVRFSGVISHPLSIRYLMSA
jgi:hypothetical protein